jgi:hypothetical protein
MFTYIESERQAGNALDPEKMIVEIQVQTNGRTQRHMRCLNNVAAL